MTKIRLAERPRPAEPEVRPWLFHLALVVAIAIAAQIVHPFL